MSIKNQDVSILGIFFYVELNCLPYLDHENQCWFVLGLTAPRGWEWGSKRAANEEAIASSAKELTSILTESLAIQKEQVYQEK